MILALFDIDGTLIDAGGSGRLALCRAFEAVFGVGEMRERGADVPFDGATDRWIFGEFASRAGIAADEFAAMSRTFEAVYLDLLEGILRNEIRPRVLPGVEDLLDRLVEIPVLVGLVTGNFRQGAMVKLRSVDLDGRFEEGAFGDDSSDRGELGKLARERFETLHGSGIDPGRTLLIGDSRQDVRAALANGYRSLAVGTGWTSLEDLEAEGPERVLPDLSGTRAILDWLEGKG